ncbi:MAG: flagellar filament capping protein FliD [Thermotogae bacterium]|nr:flagellar filament capping protein FliD [Thermotogota bacterium]
MTRITGYSGMGQTQILGLSGVDTGAIIDAIMELESRPLERLQQKQEKLELTQQLWQEIDDRLEEFRDQLFDLKLRATFYQFTTDVGDTTVLQASASADARAGTFYVKVESTASATRYESGETIGVIPDSTTQYQNLDSRVTPVAGTVTINGVEITIDATDTIDDIVNKINSSGAGVTASYSDTTGKLTLSASSKFTLGASTDTSNFLSVFNLSDAPMEWDGLNYNVVSTAHVGAVSTSRTLSSLASDDGVTFTDGTITINGTSISVSGTDTLEDVIDRINDSDANVIAFYDTNEDKLVVINKTYGTQGISFDDGGTGFFKVMGWLDDSTGNDITQKNVGNSAKILVSYDGTDATATTYYSNSNTVEVDGVTLTLRSTSTDYVRVSVEVDTDSIVQEISDFVESYNELMEYLYNKLNEEPVEDKDWEDMTDEEKMQGLLKDDASLRKIFNDLRAWITMRVEDVGEFDALWDVGISTGENLGGDYENMMKGQLEINEDTLRDAIQNHLDDLWKLFNATEDEDGADGLINVLYDKVWNYTKFGGYIDQIAGISGRLAREIRDVSDQIMVWAMRLQKRYEQLYREFTAMEQAISYLNMQSAWLAQSLGGSSSRSS